MTNVEGCTLFTVRLSTQEQNLPIVLVQVSFGFYTTLLLTDLYVLKIVRNLPLTV